MTAVCGGAASQPQAGVGPWIILSADKLASLAVWGEMEWITSFLPGLGFTPIDSASFCAQDPPTYTVPDAATWASYFSPTNPQGGAQLRATLTPIIGHFLWYQLCECATPPQPSPPAPIPQPPGLSLNPPSVGPPLQQASCATGNYTFGQFQWASNGSLFNRFTVPANNKFTTDVFAHMEVVAGYTGAGTYPINWTFQPEFVPGTPLGPPILWNQLATAPAATPMVFEFTWPQPTQFLAMTAAAPPANAGLTFVEQNNITFYCDGPPRPQQPCCPPDETSQQLLYQIYSTVQEILADLGGKRPFVDSTVHAGLTGTGAVAISPSAAAIRVDITSRAPSWPDNPGTPDFLFSIGFITPFAVGTPLRGSRLVYDHQIFEYPSYTDQIGYTLPAGVTISIVELNTAP